MTKGIGRNERVIASLNDLAEAFKNNDYRAYQTLLRSAKLSKEFTKRLTSKDDTWRKSKSADYQAAAVEIISNVIQNVDEDIKEQEIVCADAGQKLQMAEKALKEAEAKYRDARKYFDNQMSKKKKLEGEKKATEGLRVQEIKKLEQIRKLTLVHPTATLSSLDKRRETTIICTKIDAKRMGFTRFVDYVFECTDGNLVDKEVLKKVQSELGDLEEFSSAVEYVKMVVRYWAENKEYELLYNSEAIKQMLENLGIE